MASLARISRLFVSCDYGYNKLPYARKTRLREMFWYKTGFHLSTNQPHSFSGRDFKLYGLLSFKPIITKPAKPLYNSPLSLLPYNPSPAYSKYV